LPDWPRMLFAWISMGLPCETATRAGIRVLSRSFSRTPAEDGVDVRRRGELSCLVGVVLVGVDRREGEHERTRAGGPKLLGDAGEAKHLVDVEQHVVDPGAADAVHVELAHPRVHQRVGGDPESDRGVGPHAGALGGVRHRGDHRVETAPGILAHRAHEHLEQRGGGEVDGVKPGAVGDRCYRQGHTRGHPHPPDGLLSVAERGIEDLDVRHGVFLPIRVVAAASSHRVLVVLSMKSRARTS